MNPSGSPLKQFGLVLFSIGVLLAFVLTGLMVWADVESFSYGFPRVGNEPMTGLSCPVFMNETDGASFSVTLKNTTDRELDPQVKVYLSEPSLFRWSEDTKPVPMAPGQEGAVGWDVSTENVVLGNFVLIKAYSFASYPLPDVEGSCGMFVVDIPGISGTVLYWLWLAMSIALLALGLWLRDLRNQEAEQRYGRGLARKVLAVLSVIGLFVGSMGWWVVGIIVLVVIAIALPAVLLIGNTGQG